MNKCLLLFALLCPLSVGASPMMCSGSDPQWQLLLDNTEGFFDFQGKQTQMEVADITKASNAETPIAYTLISDFDTAIVLIDARACGAGAASATVLTQRRSLPVVLTTCCQVP